MEKSKGGVRGFLQATGYLDSHLPSGEIPLYRAHLSWVPVFVHQIPFILIAGIVGGIVWGILGNFALGLLIYVGLFIIGIIAQFPRIYQNVSTDILITNRGIRSKKRLFAIKDDKFTEHSYVNDIELDYSGVLQRVFKYGDVTIPLINSGEEYMFRNVCRPQTLKKACNIIKMNHYSGSNPITDRRSMPDRGDAPDSWSGDMDSMRQQQDEEVPTRGKRKRKRKRKR